MLRRHRITVEPSADGDGTLVVTGTGLARVGELAASAGVVLHELAVHRGSLEKAFMHITGHDVEYTTADPHPAATRVAVPTSAGS